MDGIEFQRRIAEREELAEMYVGPGVGYLTRQEDYEC